jgi:hypothetical protein
VTVREIVAGDLIGQEGLDQTTALQLLRFLQSRRVIREIGDDGPYELAHEVMVAKIWEEWVSEADIARLNVRDLLRRELTNYTKFGHLLDAQKLVLIYEQRDTLPLDPDMLDFIVRSAITHDFEVAYWFDRVQDAGVPVDTIALSQLQGASFRARTAAVTMLSHLGKQFAQPIIDRLADDYPLVRAAAIRALEKVDPTGKWHTYLVYERYIDAGRFTMGDNNKETNERPAHEVEVKSFYIGRYPVTNAEYKRYMDDIGRGFVIPKGKANHPVVNVSWYDAHDYAAWAGMNLLTEAQWEKAASWDDKRWRKYQYPWGDRFDASRCNTSESGIHDTTSVGTYSLAGDSSYGVGDIAGNVWEWTISPNRTYPYRTDGRSEEVSTSHVVRGGSFFQSAMYGRTTCRRNYDSDSRNGDLGFRVGLTL